MPKFTPSTVTRDVESAVKNDFSTQTIDALMYYLFEVKLEDDQRELVKETLLGKARYKSKHLTKNSDIVTSDFCSSYASYRALGLTQRDASAAMGITLARLESILHGENLTPKQHQMILHAELSGEAHLKARCFQAIDKNIQDGSWKAAVALLEKRFPKEYGRKLEIDSSSSVKWSSEECANAATQAKIELERLRAERNEINGISQEELYVESQENGGQA